ncbi:Lipoprotein signal peptidase [Candidatus Erwinia haradaeae]|uniref:Lipoprotein signal peptidase n=1 Tax=Candidatus Erwinia haradaeae TaxID=1922217 RepID=A0A451DD84_9GAMM|nr:Lipoprotein signal peptidase [Candidatus Erwinia haradaeae]
MHKDLRSCRLRWLWISFIVLNLDILSKKWVTTHLLLHQSISIIPCVNLYYAHNFGAAFSFLSDQDGWQRWFLSAITSFLLMILLINMYYSQPRSKLHNCAHALLIGGALGNLYDRIHRGFVVDFIDLYMTNWHFATFNIADIAICIGVFLVLLKGVIVPKADKNQKS